MDFDIERMTFVESLDLYEPTGVLANWPDNKVMSTKDTKLHFAASHGKVDEVKRLLGLMWKRDVCGWTALHIAADYGSYDSVKLLLPTMYLRTNGGDTALHFAVKADRLEIVRRLIESYKVKDDKSPEEFSDPKSRAWLILNHYKNKMVVWSEIFPLSFLK